ncbi:MAG: SAM-dependent methyltransferase, partial [Myxococcales bacterium]
MTLLTTTRMPIAQALSSVLPPELPVRIEAYDGSVGGDPDAPFGFRLVNQRGLAYILTAPGDLGMARAYVSGDLEVRGVHPGDPYDLLNAMRSRDRFRRPTAHEVLDLVRSVGLSSLRPPPPPAAEHLPKWRRVVEGARHSRHRDA